MTIRERIDGFLPVLWQWYQIHRRELPWRDLWDLAQDDRAYRVWISEVMLQQTQVARVIGSYKKFIQEFPTVHALAQASNREVLLAWRGMGYNSRALRLRDGARVMVSPSKADGCFPQSMEALMAIPGIGPYTAGAIRTFAFDLPTPVIDTNIRRILHRTFIGPEDGDGTWKADDKKLAVLMTQVMDAWIRAGHRGSELLSALMDYGSLVQTKTYPAWDICALSQAGIMVTTRQRYEKARRATSSKAAVPAREPGRFVGTRYIPNRIFRGRILEVLRDHPAGLTLPAIGSWISTDYSGDLEEWLQGLIKKLVQDGMMRQRGKRYVLGT